jgi:hypothetical protein
VAFAASDFGIGDVFLMEMIFGRLGMSGLYEENLYGD